MNKAYLLTGGNTGNTKAYLTKATQLIGDACGRISKKSALYETAAWGKTDQPPFINQALLLNTLFDAPALMQKLLTIEEEMGRKREEKYGPRIIDIDILLFNDAIINCTLVAVPHPQLHNRRFALTPLAEIASRLTHPVLQKSIAALLKECPDQLPVKKLS
jgi:2-amino-4-hydroxy-6-hydroxymethyldihydropteridine diphosphokinase